MSFVSGICLILISLTYVEVAHITNFNELSEESVSGFFTCMSQLNASLDTCGDMLDTNMDHSDSKFDGCKCLLPCISKIIGTMNVEDGKWNEETFWRFADILENPEWKADAQEIGKNCADRVNTHCSAGYPLIKCAMKHSKMLQNLSLNYMNQKKADAVALNNTKAAEEYEDD